MTVLLVAFSLLAGNLLGLIVLWPGSAVFPLLAGLLIAGCIFERKAVFVFALGFALANTAVDRRLNDRLDPSTDRGTIAVTGVVDSMPRKLPGAYRFEFKPLATAAGRKLPARLVVSWYRSEFAPAPGEIWQLGLRLRPPRGGVNPGGFDYEGWLFRKNIGATAYVDNQADNHKLADDGGVSSRWLAFRFRLARSLKRYPVNAEWHGLLNGLALGDRRDISEHQWQVLRATGTVHLMAISGLHIGIAAAVGGAGGAALWMLIPMLNRRLARRDMSLMAGFAIAVIYALLAGLSLPTQRALIMLLSIGLSLWWRRSASAGQGMALALIVILLLDPLATAEPGFWLSFGAVASLLLVLSGRATTAAWWRGLLRAQAAVFVGLLPVGLAIFALSAPAGLVANLVFIPLFTICLVPLILFSVAAALTGFDSLAAVVLKLVGEIFALSWPWLEWLAANIPPLTFAASGFQFVLLAALGTVYLLAPGWPGRWLGLFMLLPILLPAPESLPAGAARIVFLDVGQGLAVVVETANHLLVYDPGPRYGSGADAGSRTVIPYLVSRGKRTLDLIMVSHGDADHSGGLDSLRAAYPDARILAGGGDRQPAATGSCMRGQRWRWDGVDFQVLHPDGPSWQGNDASCVLLIRTAASSALLAGDIQAPAENYLLDTLGQTDVVLVTHHGSASSSTEAWVSVLCARLAVVSSGYRNRWGFPKAEVVGRWRAAGAEVLDTGHSGAISLVLPATGGLLQVRRARADSLPVWRIAEQELYLAGHENKGFELSGSAPGAVSCREFDSS